MGVHQGLARLMHDGALIMRYPQGFEHRLLFCCSTCQKIIIGGDFTSNGSREVILRDTSRHLAQIQNGDGSQRLRVGVTCARRQSYDGGNFTTVHGVLK